VAAVLFKSEEEAARAIKEKQKHEIGGRWVILHDLEIDDYKLFEDYRLEDKQVRCSDAINDENCAKCVKIRGLPWTANKSTVFEFFQGFSVKNVTIDIQAGKNTGFAVVELGSEDEAKRAIVELDRKTIGQRWIGVSAAEVRRRRQRDADTEAD
jgi:RNA recognition motif-containing protein